MPKQQKNKHDKPAKDRRILGIESGMSETPDQTKKQSLRKRQARAMTRAIDRVSDEFIEAFSQTGLDDGPEKPKKAEPARQALLDREERELADKSAAGAETPKFKGLGALLASSAKKPTGNFARVLDKGPPAAAATSDANADGSVIKVRDTVGKKRGLYTSCMQRPDEAQLKAWAKMAEIEKAEAENIKAEKVQSEKARPERMPVPATSAETRSVLHKLASTSHTPSRQPLITPAAPVQTTPQTDQQAKNKKTCAIRGGCAKLGGLCQRIFGWLKARL